MGIQNWSDNIILINLAQEPQLGEELQTVIGTITEKGNADVVVDFADVDIVTSSSISKLLKLRKVLSSSNHRLVFSSVSPQTRQIFTITGLDTVFEFAQEQFIALAGLQLVE